MRRCQQTKGLSDSDAINLDVSSVLLLKVKSCSFLEIHPHTSTFFLFCEAEAVLSLLSRLPISHCSDRNCLEMMAHNTTLNWLTFGTLRTLSIISNLPCQMSSTSKRPRSTTTTVQCSVMI